jgi:hypothetical protein
MSGIIFQIESINGINPDYSVEIIAAGFRNNKYIQHPPKQSTVPYENVTILTYTIGTGKLSASPITFTHNFTVEPSSTKLIVFFVSEAGVELNTASQLLPV